jgi:hypothetical protein
MSSVFDVAVSSPLRDMGDGVRGAGLDERPTALILNCYPVLAPADGASEALNARDFPS